MSYSLISPFIKDTSIDDSSLNNYIQIITNLSVFFELPEEFMNLPETLDLTEIKDFTDVFASYVSYKE